MKIFKNFAIYFIKKITIQFIIKFKHKNNYSQTLKNQILIFLNTLCISYETNIVHLQTAVVIQHHLSHFQPRFSVVCWMLTANSKSATRRRPRCKPLNYEMASRAEGLQATTLCHDSPPGFRPPFHVFVHQATSLFSQTRARYQPFFFIFKQLSIQ